MRRPSPAFVLAFIALSIALGGGAYAAKKIRSSDIARNAVRTQHLKDGQVALRDLSRGVKAQLYRRAATGARGATGPRGATGSRGRTGSRGSTGLQGPAGPAGSATDTLASGRTLRGAYVLSGAASAPGATEETAITFVATPANAPAVHWIPTGATSTTECPGTAGAPSAAAGHLCVYEAAITGLVASRSIFDPTLARPAGEGRASRFGAGLRVSADAAGAFSSQGTWAVTAG